MKSLLKSLASVFVFAIMWTSCDVDPCKDVVCGDEGVCNEGICVCNLGYEKDSAGLCNVMWSSKFVGTYNIQDSCYGISGNQTYLYQSVATQVDAQTIAVSNFAGFNNSVNVEVTSSFDLSLNNVVDAGNRTFNGTGYINGDDITLNYVVTYSDNTTDTCVAQYTRQ